MKQEDEIISSVPLIRPVLDQIADKWSIMILVYLCRGPQRFNAIKSRLCNVTQKALTHTLRRLERSGLVQRRILPKAPIGVEYSLTPLGHSLQEPFTGLYEWAKTHADEIQQAQEAFDSRPS